MGYAPNSWDALIKYFKAKGVAPALLEKAGLVVPGRKQGEFYDRFRGRAIFPIFTVTGKAVAFGGRSLFGQDPKYLNSPDTPLYSKGHLLYGLNVTKDAIREAGEFILVEGYTDFLSLYQAGRRNVVASLGTALPPPGRSGDALRPESGHQLRRRPGRTVRLPGGPAVLRKGVETRVLILPENLIVSLKRSGRTFFTPGAAPSTRKFVIDYLSREKRLDVPEVKTRVLRAVMDVVEGASRTRSSGRNTSALRPNISA